MGLYRCHNPECDEDPMSRLMFDFECDGSPVCPKCGADPKNAHQRSLITKLEYVHFHVEDKNGPVIGRGAKYRIACQPDKKHLGMATGEPSGVSCPACKETAEYKQTEAVSGFQGKAPKVVDLPEQAAAKG